MTGKWNLQIQVEFYTETVSVLFFVSSPAITKLTPQVFVLLFITKISRTLSLSWLKEWRKNLHFSRKIRWMLHCIMGLFWGGLSPFLWSVTCLLLRRFVFRRGERETRVTGNEAQCTMGRTKKTREAPFRPFSPSHLPLRANFYPEREKRLGTRQDCCRVAGESGPKFSPEHSQSAFRYNTSSKIRAFKELPLNI